METVLAYCGSSRLESDSHGQMLRLEPNLRREPVAFDAALAFPLRFREAISALHDVVIHDLRYRPKDKTAYRAWLESEQQRTKLLRAAGYQKAAYEFAGHAPLPVPEDLTRRHNDHLRDYWRARDRHRTALMLRNQPLWRRLFPFDPIVTVADDAVLFECFSADESAYGCLSVDRDDGFGRASAVRPGTTNVDYSWDLYRHFQELRSFREARLRVEPESFQAVVEGKTFREEKIDLPPSWLAGMQQIQTAMNLPLKRVELSREAVYSALAYLKRHRARTTPRAVRFELEPGKPPRLVLEPWNVEIVSWGTTYGGVEPTTVRIWGRDRLHMLGRILPLTQRFEVHLLGDGQPSFWVARMGEMTLVVGLSGWTANDWTRSAALDLLLPVAEPPAELLDHLAGLLQRKRQATLDELTAEAVSDRGLTAAALNRLARNGQVIYDLAVGRYRWRQVLDRPLTDAAAERSHPELDGCRVLVARHASKGGAIRDERTETLPNGRRRTVAKVDGHAVELETDLEGRIAKGKCGCDWYRRSGLRKGPCRHLLALRQLRGATEVASTNSQAADQWYARLLRWAGR